MVEIIDKNTGAKMLAMVIGGFSYDNNKYVVYTIKRNQEEANVFVSKLVPNSQGMAMDHKFSNGEKEVCDGIIQRIFNKSLKTELVKDGISIFDDVNLGEINYFDIDLCYVTTVLVSLVKECMIFYQLVSERVFNRPVVEVIESKKKFNEGFASNIAVIIMGLVVVVFSVYVLIGVLFR